jgi:hypothetical protein
MKQALKAKSIGEKLYQLERIHSKLIPLCIIHEALEEKNDNDKSLFKNTIISLRSTLECFNDERNNKSFFKYLKNIETILFILNTPDKKNLFKSICNLNGAYIKFKRKTKKQIKSSCEIDFQNICMPLFILDYKFIRKRKYKL